MSRAILCASFILAGTVAFAQSFEVASVRQTNLPGDGSPAGMKCSGGPGTSDPERLSCSNAPLKMLICIGYGVQFYQVTGPGWMDTDGYDIAARIPAGATREEYQRMLRSLLAERLKLALHHESKALTTHSLAVAKGGIKFQNSANNAASNPGFVVGTEGKQVHVTAKRQPLSSLAGFLSTKLGVDGPATNATGLSGDYDFTLEFTYDPSLTPDSNGLSLFTALESQLGLKLEVKRAPVDVLVVDQAEKKPADN